MPSPRGKAAALARRIGIGLCAMLLPATALAGSGGVGIPETAGPGAGAASADARGLFYNPAAAVGANGSELWTDVSIEFLSQHYQRAGTDSNGNPYPGADAFDFSPVPHIAFRTDSFGSKSGRGRFRPGAQEAASRWGLGLTLAAPFGRNVHWKPDYPGRYHLISVNFFNAYLIPSFAFRATPTWRIGAGPILVVSQYDLHQRVDLGPTLAQQMGGPVAAETGLLQGDIQVNGARGFEPGFTFGTLLDLDDGALTLGASFLSGSISTATGKARVQPSLDFAVHANSDFKLTRSLPPIVNLGGRFRPPETPIELSLETQYVGWHVVKTDEVVLSHSQLVADNQTLNDLLNALGVNQGTLVSGLLDQKQVVARNWHDSFSAILGAEYIWAPMRSRFEIGYDKSAIPDENVNPGNLDFDSLVLGASTTYEPKDHPIVLQVSLSQYLNNGRNIKTSKFSSDADPSTGYAYPTGNGTYSAVLTRFGMSFGYKF